LAVLQIRKQETGKAKDLSAPLRCYFTARLKHNEERSKRRKVVNDVIYDVKVIPTLLFPVR
jgi:hypothetical protein